VSVDLFSNISTAKSSGGGSKKKLTAFNKFMASKVLRSGQMTLPYRFLYFQQTEMARLKEDEPDITHKERYLFTY
jgi:hypothetical protein